MGNRQVHIEFPFLKTWAKELSDYNWGVVDLVPETNFPDIRNRVAIHSDNGSCMIIPREGDKARLYIQLSDQDVIDPATGRVDQNRMSAEELLAVCQYATVIRSLSYRGHRSERRRFIRTPSRVDMGLTGGQSTPLGNA